MFSSAFIWLAKVKGLILAILAEGFRSAHVCSVGGSTLTIMSAITNVYSRHWMTWRWGTSFSVSKTRLLLIHLLTYDTSFYIKEGLENLTSLEFISYQAFLGSLYTSYWSLLPFLCRVPMGLNDVWPSTFCPFYNLFQILLSLEFK